MISSRFHFVAIFWLLPGLCNTICCIITLFKIFFIDEEIEFSLCYDASEEVEFSFCQKKGRNTKGKLVFHVDIL